MFKKCPICHYNHGDNDPLPDPLFMEEIVDLHLSNDNLLEKINLSRKRKGLILLLEDDLRAWLLRQGLGRRGRRNIKRTLGKYD